MDRDRVERVVRALVHEARVEKIPFLAGSIAYHAFISLLPLFALLLFVASSVGDGSMEAGLIALGRAVFTEGAQEILIQEIRDSSRSAGLSGLGIVVLLWGTLRIFRGLDTAFSDIYETEAANTFVDQIRDGLLMLVTVAVAILAALVVNRLLPAGGPLAALQPLVLVVGLTITLVPMYYLFPDTDVTVVEILPGAAFASVGLTLFQAVFQLYVRSGEQTVVGGILLLLTWLYASGLVILLGAVLNAVLSNRSADVSIQPVVGGVSPHEASAGWTRSELHAALSTVRARTHAETPIGITVGEETVDLPAPNRVGVDTSESVFGPDTTELELTLTWIPDPEDDDQRDG
jgi:membrane protein